LIRITASSETTRFVCFTDMSGNAVNQACAYARTPSISVIGAGVATSFTTKSSAKIFANPSASWESQAAIPWSSIRSTSSLDMSSPSLVDRASKLLRSR